MATAFLFKIFATDLNQHNSLSKLTHEKDAFSKSRTIIEPSHVIMKQAESLNLAQISTSSSDEMFDDDTELQHGVFTQSSQEKKAC